jgi:hypothetical protein
MNPPCTTLTTADADRWRAVLPAELCVTGCVEYLRICERQTGWPARLLVVGGEQPLVAYPFLLRNGQDLPWAEDAAPPPLDTTSPEYRGPLVLPGARPEEIAALDFPRLFTRYCGAQGIVAEFAHLNPWNGTAPLIDPACMHTDREIVYVDLTQTEEEIWTRSFTTDGRRQTRQGQRAGVTVRRASSAEDVRTFHRLHTETMERRQALARYFHPLEHFLAFYETMPEHAFFVLAEYDGRTVAGGLFLQDATDLYWHLSAADREFAHVRPVNVYVHETIRAALGTGRRRLIMGGGYAEGDGVFRFKTNFSPLRALFCTYERVHDPAAYAALMQAWSEHHGPLTSGDGFFPAYRATPRRSVCATIRDSVVSGACLGHEWLTTLLPWAA